MIDPPNPVYNQFVGIRMTNDLRDLLVSYCHIKQQPMSKVIRAALFQFLKQDELDLIQNGTQNSSHIS